VQSQAHQSKGQLLTVSPAEAMKPSKSRGARKLALLTCKLALTGCCLWYAMHQIDLAGMRRIVGTFDFTWAVLATLVVAVEIPLVALRWRDVLNTLSPPLYALMPARSAIAIMSIGVFFGQVLPSVAGDAIRVWLLARLGATWRLGVTSVVIDRGVGLLALFVIGFFTLLFPSALTALGGHRMVILAVFGSVLVAAFLGIILVPVIAPILERWGVTRMIGRFAVAVYQVLAGSWRSLRICGLALAVHLLTILSVCLLGRAHGLALSTVDAAVLFTIMVGISVLPISIGGWGLREVAVMLLLQSHGIASEQALFFSVSFGLILIVASLPGAIVWAYYEPARDMGRIPVEE
jgi:uncharacterized membrane protein YbhN (UPF0104 family)